MSIPRHIPKIVETIQSEESFTEICRLVWIMVGRQFIIPKYPAICTVVITISATVWAVRAGVLNNSLILTDWRSFAVDFTLPLSRIWSSSIANIIHKTKAIGASPKRKSPFQPSAGANQPAKSAEVIEPIWPAIPFRDEIRPIFPIGTIPAMIAMATPYSPPTPIPAMKRMR